MMVEQAPAVGDGMSPGAPGLVHPPFAGRKASSRRDARRLNSRRRRFRQVERAMTHRLGSGSARRARSHRLGWHLGRYDAACSGRETTHLRRIEVDDRRVIWASGSV